MPKSPQKNLTALSVKKLTEPGKLAAGHCLYLHISNKSGGGVAKRWYWRGSVGRGRKEVSIGPVSEFTLAEAREIAIEWNKIARFGGDPASEKKKSSQLVLTFEEAARTCHKEAIAPGLSNEKHAHQWLRTLETYAFPKLGKRPINAVTQEEVIKVISPIWLSKHETASRTLQRIRRVFEWARPRSDCQLGNQMNPADIPRDVLPNVPKSEQQHRAALPYSELPNLMRGLRMKPATSAAALQFLILTACRPVEVRGAKWSEFDLDKCLWTIPSGRMKARSSHHVPLSDAAVAILDQVKGLSETLVFPAIRDAEKMMSDSTMNMLLERMGIPRDKTTVHGFRSTFRDWAEENTGYAYEVKEMALAHTIKNKAEAAYRRTKLIDKRRELMNEWAEFATGD